jgi:hypothetical protein
MAERVLIQKKKCGCTTFLVTAIVCEGTGIHLEIRGDI